ncbi:hypothetical protein J2Y45_003450 [Dyadobacter sp. BE34]|uniref:DUF306 domain-containing protein n=1 Tax=Dyadobacter fermentans TaxID=94254 RepID=A0ABU1QYT2_9BACT|nr:MULTISPECIES: hypothetical protein [Dyadobacter]MDR6806258.1 hypothetical protein [Dyadobacter fermentans]MDR7043999.1 hypothetical protein [Dyadobacter sp. BE242]MDR7198310.1 hypothetical protein [Dyadobacter sp. BE34]MDR7216273.1 hypothetical protein [Dyadobacter sp. BE31]MDR7264201.1 hypothetical protein [Dyadobacter sp. BE32]
MTSLKLFILFITITMMHNHGIIYRTGSKRPAHRPRELMEDRIKPKPANMLGTWRISGVSTTEQGVVQPDGRPLRQYESGDKHNMLISFFPDSTFTRVGTAGEYTAGKWDFDSVAHTIFLTSNRKTEEIGVFFSYADNGMRLVNFEFSPNESVSLIEYGHKLMRFQEDPYFGKNNWWRIKPAKSENEVQIRARLLNYLAHTASILSSAQIREQNYISMEFSQGIVKLYNVGVGVVKKDKIPATWLGSFYSVEEAHKAYDMFEDYLFTAKHKKYQSGNWVRDDHHILVDIHNGMKRK